MANVRNVPVSILTVKKVVNASIVLVLIIIVKGGEQRQYRPRTNYNREGGEQRPYSPRPRTNYNREGGEQRPYTPRPRFNSGEGGEQRPYSPRPRVGGYNQGGGYNREGGDRPYRPRTGGITKVEDTTVLTVRVPVIIIRMLNIA